MDFKIKFGCRLKLNISIFHWHVWLSVFEISGSVGGSNACSCVGMKSHSDGCSHHAGGKFINSGINNNSRKRKTSAAASREDVPTTGSGDFSEIRLESNVNSKPVHFQDDSDGKKPDANFKSIACMIDVVKND